jgi:hypothetical protein
MKVRGTFKASTVSRATQEKHVGGGAETDRLAKATYGFGDRTFVAGDADLTGPIDANLHNFQEGFKVKSQAVTIKTTANVFQYNKRVTYAENADGTVDMQNSGQAEYGMGLPVDRTTNASIRFVEIRAFKNGNDEIVIDHFQVV